VGGERADLERVAGGLDADQLLPGASRWLERMPPCRGSPGESMEAVATSRRFN
jgi:hypothetical protein